MFLQLLCMLRGHDKRIVYVEDNYGVNRVHLQCQKCGRLFDNY